MKNIGTWMLLLTILIVACNKDEDKKEEIVYGKNEFSTMVDGFERQYIVHVPTGYNTDSPVPVVFMLHGTSGDGLRFYNISGWKELGEQENIITVYPSSWRHCVIDDGERKNTTKWNVYPGSFEYCQVETPLDDVKFLRKVLSEVESKYSVDAQRVYLVGFSNGGQMAFKCAVEMSDVFAAVVESAGSQSDDFAYMVQRDIPITFQLGSSDDAWFGEGKEIPLQKFDSLLTNVDGIKNIISTHAKSFNFRTDYSIFGDPSSLVYATFKDDPNLSNREFRFVLIKGLEHNYPNGDNHELNGAAFNWEWMKKYKLN